MDWWWFGSFCISRSSRWAYVCVQQIIFDNEHHSGVYRRVYDETDTVNHLYSNPDKYHAATLEHHTSVTLRELPLEEIRRKSTPSILLGQDVYMSLNWLKKRKKWGKCFAEIGRPTYCIVKWNVAGNCFAGDATKYFKATLSKEENLKLAKAY